MHGWVGINYHEGFACVSQQVGVDEVNFWQPGGKALFKSLRPGELFLFKLHVPGNRIAGGAMWVMGDALQ